MILYERIECVNESLLGVAAAVCLLMWGTKKLNDAEAIAKKASEINKNKMLKMLSKMDSKPMNLKAEVPKYLAGLIDDLAYKNVTNDNKMREYAKTITRVATYENDSADDKFFNNGKAKIIVSLDDDGDLLYMNNQLYLYEGWSTVKKVKMADVINLYWRTWYKAYLNLKLIDGDEEE